MYVETDENGAGTDGKPKWLNSPVTHYKGSLDSIRAFVPEFEQRAFALTQGSDKMTRMNVRLRTVVRRPIKTDNDHVPVGVVSRSYTLVQHTAVLDAAEKALNDANIGASNVCAELNITEYGERMALSLFLPEKYNYVPHSSHPMALRLECLNSVDGSTGFQALMGWFRFICSNGLIIGVTQTSMRRRHAGAVCADDIGIILKQGLVEAEAEKTNFDLWRETRIKQDNLTRWIEEDILEIWGFKAATRAFHIAMSGEDVSITGQYKGNTPTTINVTGERNVPGTNGEANNLYDISQVLAWLAKERRDIQEQMEWRRQIPGLIDKLRTRINR